MTTARAARLLAGILLLAAGEARAQFIDRVDVERTNGQSEIRIRFVTTVQYVRHSPREQGTLLSIGIRLTRPVETEGRTVLESRRVAASAALPSFTVTFPQEDGTLGLQFERAVRYDVKPGPDPNSIYVYVAAPPAAQDTEAQAAELMQSARAALGRGDAAAAVLTLNQLLNLPPNRQSQAAQELIGEARERNGEPDKARAEYELYLRLYPDGDGARRVRERLAALPTAARPIAGGRGLRRPETTEVSHSGSFSQFYYRGATKFDATLVPPAPGLQFDRVSLTALDQSSLVSSLDLTTRIRAPQYDGKLVMRDVYTADRLSSSRDPNRLYALYYEQQSADGGWLARAGRQPGATGGLLGRFDGLWAGYRFVPNLRLNAVAGAPVEFFPTQQKRLYGTSVDILPDAPGWSANLFLIEQRVDGVTDRRGTGSELRYFDEKRSAFALFDYDLYFHAVNVAMLQANLIAGGGTNYTVLLDHRRVPLLQLTNALPGQSAAVPGSANPSVAQLMGAGASRAELRDAAFALTPVSDLIMLGFTNPVTPKLQLGADFRVSQVSGTAASGNLPESPGSGKAYVYSGQAIKTGLLGASDMGVANLSLIRAESYRGYALSLSHVYLYERWRAETTARYYRQESDLGVRLARLSPSLRLVYQWREHLGFELELGEEITRTDGPLQSERMERRYFSLGYRWDFF